MTAPRLVQRGDVYVARLDPVEGSEQGGTRPVIIGRGTRLTGIARQSWLCRALPTGPDAASTRVRHSWLHLKEDWTATRLPWVSKCASLPSPGY